MFFLPKGDRSKGLKQLRLAADKGRYANYEAMHFLLGAYYNTEGKPELALPYAQKLHALFPDNPIFHKFVARTQISVTNWKEAVKASNEILKNVYARKTGYDRMMEREALHYLGL